VEASGVQRQEHRQEEQVQAAAKVSSGSLRNGIAAVHAVLKNLALRNGGLIIMELKHELYVPSPQPNWSSTLDDATAPKRARLRFRLLVLLTVFLITYSFYAREWYKNLGASSVHTGDAGHVRWVPCGKEYECANVTVPLDYHNASDLRTVSIAVTRFQATDKVNRCVITES
jgi:hypothetical protein